jgi:signal transduction histidine kinase
LGVATVYNARQPLINLRKAMTAPALWSRRRVAVFVAQTVLATLTLGFVTDDALQWLLIGAIFAGAHLSAEYRSSRPHLSVHNWILSLMIGAPLALMIPCATLLGSGDQPASWWAGWCFAFGGVQLLHSLLLFLASRGAPGLSDLSKNLAERGWEPDLLSGAGFCGIGLAWDGAWYSLALAFVLLFVSGRLRFMSDRLGEAKRREALLERLSHELRTPAAAVRSVASSLARGDVTEPEQQQRFAELVVNEADRLVTGLERALWVARGGELPPVEKVRLNLADWARQLVLRWSTLLPDLKIEAPARAAVEADPDRLDEAFDALLDNAMRHGKPPVHLRIWSDEKFIFCSVEDAGQGVAPDRIDSVRRKLVGSVDPLHKTDHRGLGTWAAGAVARAHGGRLYLDGPKTFVMLLPAAGQIA